MLTTYKLLRSILIIYLTGLCLNTQAQIVIQDVNRPKDAEPSRIVLPYAFRTETYGTAVGVFGVMSRFPQEQSSIYGTAFGSVNGSWRIWVGGTDFLIPGFDRLFLSPTISGTSYNNVHTYIDGNPDYPAVRAGAHDSNPNDYVSAPGWDGEVELRFRYVLPWGHGRENIINRVETDRGLLVSQPAGGQSMNPIASGRSYFFVVPFYRSQELKLPDGYRGIRSNGLRLEYKHDNTDFILNPTAGDVKRFAVSRDFGALASDSDWTHLELEFRKFFGLGETKLHRQRVLALNAWLSDVPTWETQTAGGTTLVTSRPPYYEGSTLGGFSKMRAYPVNRFSDRSATYYSAEFRGMPHWNPMEGKSVLGSPAVEWWQWVFFARPGV